MSGNSDDIDKMLDEYLAGKSDLSTLYAKSKTIGAPDNLADNIKSLARKELAKEHGKRKWFIPVSLAAAIVLSASVYLLNLSQPLQTTGPLLTGENSEKLLKKTEQLAKVIPAAEPKVDKVEKISAPNKHLKNEEVLAQAPVTPAARDKVIEKTHEIPAHIRDLVQPTARRAGQEEAYPAEKELKSWTRQKWAEKIHQLRQQNNIPLAEKYMQDFKTFFPQDDIEELIKKLE